MKLFISALTALTLSSATIAADIEAGKAKVQMVCAACHGAMGVSVSDTIPNLAGQRPTYLETQLKALKEGTRKNQIMNAIAGQLSADDIANVAAYFSAQPGATTATKSDFRRSHLHRLRSRLKLPHLSKNCLRLCPPPS